MELDEETIAIQKIFSGLVDGFGFNQAKIYKALLDGESKTASQLIKETGIHESVVFRELKHLIKNNVVQATGLKPKLYFVDKPLQLLDFQIKRQTKLLLLKQSRLQEIIESKEKSFTEYLIRVAENGASIKNHKTKEKISDRAELYTLKKALEQIIGDIPVENKYLAYRYKR